MQPTPRSGRGEGEDAQTHLTLIDINVLAVHRQDSQDISFPAAAPSWRPGWARFAAFSLCQYPLGAVRGSALVPGSPRPAGDSALPARTQLGQHHGGHVLPERARPGWALVGRGIGSRGQEQIRGLSRAAPAIARATAQRGQLGPGCEVALVASAGSLGRSPPLCLMSCTR